MSRAHPGGHGPEGEPARPGTRTGPVGILAVLLVGALLGVGVPAGSAGGDASGGGDVARGLSGRHVVVVRAGGDTAYLAVGRTVMNVPPGTRVSFDPLRVSTSLDEACPQWDLMARFGGRTVGDTRVVAGSWAPGGPVLAGESSYLVVRPEPMTWSVACYDDEGGPMALPSFTAHVEFLAATAFW